MDIHDTLFNCIGFEWDQHNVDKIWNKHHVSASQCEELFFNQPLIIADDIKHSQKENRYYALGQSDTGRMLFVVFTIRTLLIRVISARDMNKKEKEVYKSYEE